MSGSLTRVALNDAVQREVGAQDIDKFILGSMN